MLEKARCDEHTMSEPNRFDESLMVHNWPEIGPGNFRVEELYQLFKARMEVERCEANDAHVKPESKNSYP